MLLFFTQKVLCIFTLSTLPLQTVHSSQYTHSLYFSVSVDDTEK